MEDYNGIAISKNDKEFVVAFDNFVNGKMQSATNTGKALATIHRYLQSQAFKVCVAYFRQLAVNYRTGYYDERNETAARIAAMMYDTLMNGDEIYDPIIHRLTKSGAMKKVLYLADRNVLIDQTMTQDFRPFKSKMTKI